MPLQLLDELVRAYEKINHDLHEGHDRDMVFISPFFYDYTPYEIHKLHIDSGQSPIEVYQEVFSKEENLQKIIEIWSKNPLIPKERLEILRDALLDAHFNKKYTLSIPALIGQLEGLILEAFNIDQRKIHWVIKKAFPKLKDKNLISHLTGTYVIGEILLSEVFNSKKKNGYSSKGIYPNRPTIQHGINTTYYKSPYSSTRLIMLIDFVCSNEFQKEVEKFKIKKSNIS